jgi:hypothetical protein
MKRSRLTARRLIPRQGEKLMQKEAKAENAYRLCETHLFSFAAQFKTMDMGAVSACFSCVRIKKRWPSRVTS